MPSTMKSRPRSFVADPGTTPGDAGGVDPRIDSIDRTEKRP